MKNIQEICIILHGEQSPNIVYDDYDSDYETDPAAKIDDTMKGTVLAVAVTKKVDRRSCSMSGSMEASPQRQSGENIIAISLSQQMI